MDLISGLRSACPKGAAKLQCSVLMVCCRTGIGLRYGRSNVDRSCVEAAGKRVDGPNAEYTLWLILFGLLWFPQQLLVAEDETTFHRGEERIDVRDLKRHLAVLSSDSFEGREAGGRGGKAASAYLRSELKALRQSCNLPRETTQEFGREYQNLLVLLPGSDERLKREVIVVGAHYDHVGYGNAKNSLGQVGQIHNGADDNASGTSALLELITAFCSLEIAPPRSMLFAFWDAEEAGLLGSKHWVSHPTIPLQDIRFVMNIDMVGRLREERLVTVGWRSAPGLRTLLASKNSNHELKLAFQPRVNSDSDHYYFYAAGIPVIHFDTDKHDDYHRPGDDPEKINWAGLLTVTRFAYRVLLDAASRTDFPHFRREALKESAPSWLTPHAAVNPHARLGVNWDAEQAKKNIALVSQVTPESPAAKAGIRVGDRIVRLGPWENGSFLDLKTALQVTTNPVPIRFKRQGDERPVDVRAVLWGTPIRLGASWIEDPALPHCVAITQIVADSPADRAGISAGDIILEIGGRPINSSDDFKQQVLTEPGPIHLRLERHGCIRDVDVELMDRPSSTPQTSTP